MQSRRDGRPPPGAVATPTQSTYTAYSAGTQRSRREGGAHAARPPRTTLAPHLRTRARHASEPFAQGTARAETYAYRMCMHRRSHTPGHTLRAVVRSHSLLIRAV
eukprot:3438083-Prymnesium_polylepis.2